MSRALVLFAHGARDPQWARPFEAMRSQLHGLLPQVPIELAYLEFMSPDLSAAVTRLVGEGVTEVMVVPMFLAQGGHLKRDLPLIIESLRAAHPGTVIEASPAIGEQAEIIAALAGGVAKLYRTQRLN